MNCVGTSPVDIVEAAYDLELGSDEWLPNLLEKVAPMVDDALGSVAAIWAGPADDGRPLIAQLTVGTGPEDLGARFAQAAASVGPCLNQQTAAASAGGVRAASESAAECPTILRSLQEHVGCKDVLGIWALDPDLHGIGINIPFPTRVRMHRQARARWQRLAVHIAAGHRIRRRLGCVSELPCAPVEDTQIEAAAIIDPKRFVVTHAEGEARNKRVAEGLRQAAIRVDKARSRLRTVDPDEALEVWQGLLDGRWSMVDWFDSDGRRFVAVVPNAPDVADPRGLTEREQQVVAFAARGESSKLITYRLGLSAQRVSALLSSAMHKLGVKTQAQLVLRMRCFPCSRSDAA